MTMDGPRILVLEDDADFRGMLMALLEKEGYRVAGAARGEDALSLARQADYDLVVTDIRMEGIDGLETLSRLKEAQPLVESLVITGYSSEEDSIRAIRLGVGDYLRKPFRLDEFVGAVRRLVAARLRQREQTRQRVAWVRTLRKLAEALSRAWERQGVADAHRAASLARRLAGALKLAPEASEASQLVTLLVALERLESDLYELDDLPPGLELGLRHLEERWDGGGLPDGLSGSQIPIESRVAAVALAEDTALEGRFDPMLLALLRQPDAGGGAAVSETPLLRSLVSLARALEESGDLVAAEAAFNEVAVVRSPSREGVEARLGLARVARQTGALADIPEHLRQASHLASRVGPSVAARVALEGGIMTAECGLPGARELLEEAVRLARSLRSRAGAALALLASAALAGAELASELERECLKTLMATEYTGELAAAAGWLLPYVWASQERDSELYQSVLRRLSREAPREWESFSGRLEPGEREALPRVRSSPAAAEPGPVVPLLRIYSLGPLEVYQGEERIAERGWRSQKARYLFAYLAAAGRPVPEERIVDEFWPDDFEKGRRNLYWCTSILRGKLRPPGWSNELDYLERSGGTLGLTPDLPRWHDLEELDSHFAEAHRLLGLGDRAGAADSFRRVVALYRGPFLEGCYMDWTDPIRARVETQVGGALLHLLGVAVAEERYDEVLELAGRLLELDPCCQEAYACAMRAHVARGRPEEAVRLFEQCRARLEEDLGLAPGPELVGLRERL